MNQTVAAACVAAGGALGAVLRYLVNVAFLGRLGPGFPWSTLAINVTGSLAIGIVLGLSDARAGLHPYARLFVATGLLGGYTTFSAFSYEALALGRSGMIAAAAFYVGGSVVLGIIAAWAGMSLTRALVA